MAAPSPAALRAAASPSAAVPPSAPPSGTGAALQGGARVDACGAVLSLSLAALALLLIACGVAASAVFSPPAGGQVTVRQHPSRSARMRPCRAEGPHRGCPPPGSEGQQCQGLRCSSRLQSLVPLAMQAPAGLTQAGAGPRVTTETARACAVPRRTSGHHLMRWRGCQRTPMRALSSPATAARACTTILPAAPPPKHRHRPSRRWRRHRRRPGPPQLAGGACWRHGLSLHRHRRRRRLLCTGWASGSRRHCPWRGRARRGAPFSNSWPWSTRTQQVATVCLAPGATNTL